MPVRLPKHPGDRVVALLDLDDLSTTLTASALKSDCEMGRRQSFDSRIEAMPIVADALPNCAMRCLVQMAQAYMEGRGYHIEWHLMNLYAWDGRFDRSPDDLLVAIFFPEDTRRRG
jgi:hypothetical protein